jgi:F0F1-type ATP synthase assembly protein I
MAKVMEKADEQVTESIRKITRAASAMAEAIDEGTDVIKHAIKRSGDVAEELLDDTTQRIKRHPVETMVATFALGVVVGGFLGWLVARR